MMQFLPWLVLPASLSMISTLRMPRAAPTGRCGVDALMGVTMVVGYGFGLARRLPEYLVARGIVYMVISLRYHLVSKEARAATLPRLFPAD